MSSSGFPSPRAAHAMLTPSLVLVLEPRLFLQRSVRARSLDGRAKAVAAPADGLDRSGCAPSIVDRCPREAHRAGQRALRHGGSRPDRVEQLLLRHEALRIAREIEEQIEHLGLDAHRDAVAPELIRASIDLEAAEPVDHPAGVYRRGRGDGGRAALPAA